jgi:hypothetical protein
MANVCSRKLTDTMMTEPLTSCGDSALYLGEIIVIVILPFLCLIVSQAIGPRPQTGITIRGELFWSVSVDIHENLRQISIGKLGYPITRLY